MKKALILGILGLAAAATQSFGQGSIIFDNYDSSPYMPVTYGAGFGAATGLGVTNSNIHVDLLYTLGAASSATNDVGVSVAIQPGLTAMGQAGGYFTGGSVTIPGYVSGPVTFQVEAWDSTTGSSYGAATGAKGESAAWQESSLATGLSTANYFAGLPGPNGASLLAVVVPEPSIIALCGIGAAALMVSRRKKA